MPTQVTDQYPYSTPAANGINYIRNSVKVVVDAYNGTTDYYLADPTDPLAQTLANIFPGFLKPLSSMPADLRKHLRYPETIFAIQTAMYATYHMTNVAAFYKKEDQWEIPAIDVDGGPQTMQPYYTVMRIPGEARAEFIQMLPFTPRRKDNLSAWMVARSDPDHYGQLEVFQFPKQKVVFGPRQIVARINQDQEISPQITLWNQQGSQVIQGTLLVIPIKESLLYVRPLYLKASDGKIPELKRVIVAYQNQIVMADTLDARGKNLRRRPEKDRITSGTSSAASPQNDSRSLNQPAPPPATSSAGGPGARALSARHAGATRRQLGALRRGNPVARREPAGDCRNDQRHCGGRGIEVVAPFSGSHQAGRTAARTAPCRPRGRICRAGRNRAVVGPACCWLEDRGDQRGGPETHRRRRAAGRAVARHPRGAEFARHSRVFDGRQHHEGRRGGVRLPLREAASSSRGAVFDGGSAGGGRVAASRIEVPDSRYNDFVKVGAPQLIADLACACWYALGPAASTDGASGT
jgi:hypothetical protein